MLAFKVLRDLKLNLVKLQSTTVLKNNGPKKDLKFKETQTHALILCKKRNENKPFCS